MRRLILTIAFLLIVSTATHASTVPIISVAGAGAAGGTATVNTSANALSGDLLFLACGDVSGNSMTPSAAGWTSRCTMAGTTWGGVWSRTVGGSEPGSYLATGTNGDHIACSLFYFRSGDNTTPVFDACAGSTSSTPAAVTTTAANDLLLWITFGPWGLNAENAALPAAIVSGPNSPTFFGINAAYAEQSAAGASIQPTFTFGGGGTPSIATIAVKSNTTTAGSFKGLGAESFNNAAAALVRPVVPSNAGASDTEIAVVGEIGSTGIAITPQIGADTFTAGRSDQWVAGTVLDDCAGTACIHDTDQLVNQAGSPISLVIGAGAVPVGACMQIYMCSNGTNTDSSGLWTNQGSLAAFNTCTIFTKTATASDNSGHTYSFTSGTFPDIWFSSFHGASTCSYSASNLNSTGSSLSSWAAPGVAGCADANCLLVETAAQNNGNSVALPSNLTALAGATFGRSGYRTVAAAGSPWTEVTASGVIDPKSTNELHVYQARGLAASATMPFGFASNPAKSTGIIVVFTNLDATTPVDSKGTVALAGLDNPIYPIIAQPSANDELLFKAMIPGGLTGSNRGVYPNIPMYDGSGVVLEYSSLAADLPVIVTNGGNVIAWSAFTGGLKSATAPTRTTANARINLDALEVFSTSAPLIITNNGWFF